MKRRAGFSLIEVITVLAVLSIATAIGVRGLYAVSDQWRALCVRNELNAKATAVFETMRHDFDRMLSFARAGVPLLGEDRDAPSSIADDAIVFPIEHWNPALGRIERRNVQYCIDRGGAAPALVRTLGALGETPPSGAHALAGAGVMAMRAEYFNGRRWVRGWRRRNLPEAVRISLVMQDADRPWEQIVRVTAFTVHVE